MGLPEAMDFSFAHRERLLNEVFELIRQKQVEAAESRESYFCPDLSSHGAYSSSLTQYREKLRSLLGWPLYAKRENHTPIYTPFPTGGNYRVFRVNQPGIGPVSSYGLLFLPKDSGRYPLVIAQHGGHGSPELASGLAEGGSANYNQMITGLLNYSVAVYAPQLLVWHNAQQPKNDQYKLDRKLRHCGGSRAALDLHLVQSAMDGLCLHPEIDPARIGVCGLSYGGFYSLFLAALDERIKVAVSSCFINDRHLYDWEDLVWTGAAHHFLDSEVAMLICPRPLFLEVGKQDEVFSADTASAIAEKVARMYGVLGVENDFVFRTHDGAHEYDPDRKAESFLMRHL